MIRVPFDISSFLEHYKFTVGASTVNKVFSHVPNIAIVSYTSKIPQSDVSIDLDLYMYHYIAAGAAFLLFLVSDARGESRRSVSDLCGQQS